MATLLWVLGISLSISSLCSVLEAVLLSVTHSYVELLRDQGSKAGIHGVDPALGDLPGPIRSF